MESQLFLRTLNRMNDLIEKCNNKKGKLRLMAKDIYQTEDVIKLRTKVDGISKAKSISNEYL